MEISAALVKTLREKTGVGMMECKKALTESKGNLEAAITYLREHGLSAAAKKADRSVNEGRMFSCISTDNKTGVVLELNCETDFVGNNNQFKALGETVAKIVVDQKIASVEALKQSQIEGKPFQSFISESILKLGENIEVSRFHKIETTGMLANYVHMNGKIGVLIEFSAPVDPSLGKDIAMHIAATNPLYLKPEDAPQEQINQEKEILKKQAQHEGKPQQIIEKIVEGKMAKYLKDVCLLEQQFVKDTEKRIKQLLPQNIQIKAFVRFAFN